MLKKKETIIHIVKEELEDMVCDVTKKSLIKNRENEDVVSFATLTLTTMTKESLLKGDEGDALKIESSDLSEETYKEIMQFLRAKGAIVPSYYQDDTTVFDDGEESCDDDESLN